MSNIMVVNATSSETRVALVENGIISEFHIERHRERGVVGNVYKGKVIRVLPGMQAAFVDIGHDKAGFLHVSDFYNFEEDIAALGDEEVEDWPPPSRANRQRKVQIEDVLSEGQEIIVQVAKEPMGTKGARLTGHISLPGRYAVFMPTVSHIGISKRIVSVEERRRLRRIVDQARPEGAGFIVRTVSENVPDEKLLTDMILLTNIWGECLEKFNTGRAPRLLNEEPDLLLRATRDLFSSGLEKLVVDDHACYKRVYEFAQHFMPNVANAIEFYQSEEPIFDAYGIEIEINRALQRRVELASGGHIVIDKTEALTAVDVNTGRFVGKSTSQEETILKTNMEAAEEIIYQLRLRNIGGLIIIDFIDMDNPRHREQVYQRLEESSKKDKVTSHALAISEFGLVEMTRKRVRESIVQQLGEECDQCGGRGYIKAPETLGYDILREVRREAPVLPGQNVYVYAHRRVIDFLKNAERQTIQDLQDRSKKKIHLVIDPQLHIEQFNVSSKSKQISS